MKSFVIPVLVTIVAGLFLWWWAHETFEVRYALSERIPVDFGGAQQAAVQQLEVRNVGKTSVDHVVVKLPNRISKFKLLKNSESDETKVYPEAFELNYAEMPPGASFRLVVETDGTGIKKEEVVVRHSHGTAEEALASTSGATLSGLISLAFFTAYFVLTLSSVRNTLVESLVHKSAFRPEAVLERKRPFYLGEKTWAEVRKRALETSIRERDFSLGFKQDPAMSALYRRINEGKPGYLSAEEWTEYLDKKKRQLVEEVERIVSGWIASEDLQRFMRMRRPEHLGEGAWEDLQSKVQDRYIEVKLRELSHATSMQGGRDRPIGMSDAKWVSYQEALSRLIFAELSKNLDYQLRPIEYLRNEDLQFLSSKQKNDIEGRAYRLQLDLMPDLFIAFEAEKFLRQTQPSWMRDEDFARARARAQGTLEARSYRSALSTISGVARSIPVADSDLKDLPHDLQVGIRELERNVQQVVKKASEKVSELGKKEARVEQTKSEVDGLRAKILRQLAIVENLFTDPQSIERVESYDNPFAAGNFRMLQRLSSELMKG